MAKHRINYPKIITISRGILAAGILCWGVIPSRYYKIKQKYHTKIKDFKVLYLTFDDGPNNVWTPKLLDLLKEYNVKATFFTVADFAVNNPEIIFRMKAEGHYIALHSAAHNNALLQTRKATKADFARADKEMKKLNIDVHEFRPPWGDVSFSSLKEIKKRNWRLIDWDVMAEDWKGNTTSNIISDKLRKRVKPGCIICLHDGRGKNEAPSRTIEALERMLPQWLSEGYTFLTIENYE